MISFGLLSLAGHVVVMVGSLDVSLKAAQRTLHTVSNSSVSSHSQVNSSLASHSQVAHTSSKVSASTHREHVEEEPCSEIIDEIHKAEESLMEKIEKLKRDILAARKEKFGDAEDKKQMDKALGEVEEAQEEVHDAGEDLADATKMDEARQKVKNSGNSSVQDVHDTVEAEERKKLEKAKKDLDDAHELADKAEERYKAATSSQEHGKHGKGSDGSGGHGKHGHGDGVDSSSDGSGGHGSYGHGDGHESRSVIIGLPVATMCIVAAGHMILASLKN